MISNFLRNSIAKTYPLTFRLIPFEVYSFLVIGVINTIINILWFQCFIQILPDKNILIFDHYAISIVLAFICSVPTSYYLSKKVVFHKGTNKGNSILVFIKYMYTLTQGLVLDYFILKFLIKNYHMTTLEAKGISTCITVVINYLFQKYFAFSKK